MTAVDSADRSQLFLLETLSVRCFALCAPTVLKEVCTHGFKEVCTHGMLGIEPAQIVTGIYIAS